MAKRLTRHERAVHAARVKAHHSATYLQSLLTNGASAERIARAKATAERDAAAAELHIDHKPGECARCDLADAVIEELAVDEARGHDPEKQMIINTAIANGQLTVEKVERKLKCDMLVACKADVTHVDNKGYVYCTGHGEQRRAHGIPCRKLRPSEITKLTNDQTIKY